MKPSLFTFSGLCDDQTAQAVLDATTAVATWVQPFPHAAIVLSDLPLAELSAVLHRQFGETWFLLTELGQGVTDGWVPADLWSYVNHRPGMPSPSLPAPAMPSPGVDDLAARAPLATTYHARGSVAR